ncbi:MAG TPA: DUF4147 domain-containing protein [Thermomicrobiaceae bacterium]|nr:DUF4147 domain-containing protein [Thermomicrobiaceae bacterium]
MSARAEARAAVEAIFQAALRAVEPEWLVRAVLSRSGDGIIVGPQRITVPGRVVVLAVGKAALPMARGAEEALGDRIAGGLAVTKRGFLSGQALPRRVAVLEGAHPVPDSSSVAAGERLLALAESLGPDDLALVLISGGGSALVEAPRAGVTLPQIAAATELLLRHGADITTLNAVRRRLSRLKAGGLARAASPARVVNLIVSDVLGSPLPLIASGPSVDPGVLDPAVLAAVRAPTVWRELPPAVQQALSVVELEERSGNVVLSEVLADAASTARAAVAAARELGYQPALLSTRFEGEAREFGGFWAQLALGVARGEFVLPRPACLVGTGEMTVTVRGAGRGGRNTEMALAAALAIAGHVGVTIASLATDGDDGSSDAAGGVVSGESVARAVAAGLDPREMLQANDSARFLAACGGLIVTGATGTNVNDLYLALIE